MMACMGRLRPKGVPFSLPPPPTPFWELNLYIQCFICFGYSLIRQVIIQPSCHFVVHSHNFVTTFSHKTFFLGGKFTCKLLHDTKHPPLGTVPLIQKIPDFVHTWVSDISEKQTLSNITLVYIWTIWLGPIGSFKDHAFENESKQNSSILNLNVLWFLSFISLSFRAKNEF